MPANRARVLLIMMAAVAALALGEALLSKGMKQTASIPGGRVGHVLVIATNAWVLTGIALLLGHVGLYMLALRDADLSFALPLTAASYPLGALLAQFYLRENVGTTRWIGTFVITAGVVIIAVGESMAGDA
jgi:drug/metabolite transporter (DMT)-like permease